MSAKDSKPGRSTGREEGRGLARQPDQRGHPGKDARTLCQGFLCRPSGLTLAEHTERRAEQRAGPLPDAGRGEARAGCSSVRHPALAPSLGAPLPAQASPASPLSDSQPRHNPDSSWGLLPLFHPPTPVLNGRASTCFKGAFPLPAPMPARRPEGVEEQQQQREQRVRRHLLSLHARSRCPGLPRQHRARSRQSPRSPSPGGGRRASGGSPGRGAGRPAGSGHRGWRRRRRGTPPAGPPSAAGQQDEAEPPSLPPSRGERLPSAGAPLPLPPAPGLASPAALPPPRTHWLCPAWASAAASARRRCPPPSPPASAPGPCPWRAAAAAAAAAAGLGWAAGLARAGSSGAAHARPRPSRRDRGGGSWRDGAAAAAAAPLLQRLPRWRRAMETRGRGAAPRRRAGTSRRPGSGGGSLSTATAASASSSSSAVVAAAAPSSLLPARAGPAPRRGRRSRRRALHGRARRSCAWLASPAPPSSCWGVAGEGGGSRLAWLGRGAPAEPPPRKARARSSGSRAEPGEGASTDVQSARRASPSAGQAGGRAPCRRRSCGAVNGARVLVECRRLCWKERPPNMCRGPGRRIPTEGRSGTRPGPEALGGRAGRRGAPAEPPSAREEGGAERGRRGSRPRLPDSLDGGEGLRRAGGSSGTPGSCGVVRTGRRFLQPGCF